MQFEWDENKREKNLAKHGLDLATGVLLFDGRSVYSYPSSRDGEERFVTVGIIIGRLLALVWTKRETAIRFISLRSARDAEKRKYSSLYGG